MAAVSCATAQLTVEVVLDQDEFLRDEPLPVKVRVTNRSGQTLQLGKDNEWLSFVVHDSDGPIMTKLGVVPVTGEFTLASAQVVTRGVDLAPYFELGRPGRYQVTATVRIKEWNAETTSKPKTFEIVRGTRLWEEEFGVPASSGAPEVRKYTLQQANYRKQLRLYARISDATESSTYGVIPLGQLVSFSRPEAQIDKTSNLHVLFQTGPRSFLYTMVAPDGQITARQTHDYSGKRPILRSDETNRISVVGGQRRFTTSDLPPSLLTNLTGLLPDDPATTNTAPAPPAKGNAKNPKKK